MIEKCLYSPVKGKDAPKAMVQTLGTSQVQHPGNPLWPVHETRADGVCAEVGTALAGVWHAKGVRHLQTGGADLQGGPAGDEQVRNISLAIQRLLFILPGMRNDCLSKSACLWNSLQHAGRSSRTRFTSAPSVFVRWNQYRSRSALFVASVCCTVEALSVTGHSDDV